MPRQAQGEDIMVTNDDDHILMPHTGDLPRLTLKMSNVIAGTEMGVIHLEAVGLDINEAARGMEYLIQQSEMLRKQHAGVKE